MSLVDLAGRLELWISIIEGVWSNTRFNQAEDNALPYDLIKDSLLSVGLNLRVESLFYDAQTNSSKALDQVLDIENIRFDIDLLTDLVLILMDRSSEAMRLEYKLTSETMIDTLYDWSDPKSAWSLQKARLTAHQLLHASSEIDVKVFKSRKKGYKLRLTEDRQIIFGDRAEYLDAIASAMISYFNSLDTYKQAKIRNYYDLNEDSLVTVGVGSGNGIGVAVGAAVLVQPMQKAIRRKK